MTDRSTILLLRSLVTSGAAMALVGMATVLAIGYTDVLLSEGGPFLLFSMFFGVIVWVVAPRQPRNKILWIMTASTFLEGLYVASWSIAALVLPDPAAVLGAAVIPADLPPTMAWILAVTLSAGAGAFVSLVTLGLLLFPDGSLPSKGWRWAVGLSAIAILFMAAGIAWEFRPWASTAATESSWVQNLAAGVFVLTALVCLTALAGRFLKSTGTTRQQFKWILWGATILVLSIATLVAFQGTAGRGAMQALFVLASAAFVASYGIAVGKYRLYEVDVIISRTFVFGTLAAFITGVYMVAVVGAGSLLQGESKSNALLAVSATALVAIAFEPVRTRMQRLANRLVYGRRATPYEVLSEFSRKITATDEELLDQVARSLAEGTTAASAAVWIQRDDRLERVAMWPDVDGPSALAIGENETNAGSDVIRTVTHDGESLGALSLSPARGQSVLPTDERLLEQVASGMGLALRNMRLSKDLRERVVELRESRRRLVTVQDETRHQIEKRLHGGAQQRLAALKVKLDLTEKQAERSGFGEVATLIQQATDDTDRAIMSLRDFARGVYPPLLEAEGPVSALASQARRLPIEVDVDADDVRRHARMMEAAVYFCVLEALQNVVKHAGASSARVAIRDDEEYLVFEVTDDGRGFDPAAVSRGSGLANLADRLEAMDGHLEVISSPGHGSTIRGTIPTRWTGGPP